MVQYKSIPAQRTGTVTPITKSENWPSFETSCAFSARSQLTTHGQRDRNIPNNASGKARTKQQNPRLLATMFSWSNGNGAKTYPGRRISRDTAEASTGPTFTRAQHLKSYVEDPTLQRSTRRVSSGTFSTAVML